VRNCIAETAANEIMVASAIFDHAARLRSYEILGELAEEFKTGAAPTAGS